MENKTINKTENIFGKAIHTYMEDEAVEDGILFDITVLNKEWKRGIFSHITGTLLSKGYNQNANNILDLLNQANQIVKKVSENFTKHDHFFSGKIELPNGSQQEIFICQNSLGKFTIMLPGDY